MSTIQTELSLLREEVLNMMFLIQKQMEGTYVSFKDHNQELAEVIYTRDKQVNSFDLLIEKGAEKILALHNVVASDLRFILSVLSINKNLEIMGDNFKEISKFMIKKEQGVYDLTVAE